MTPGSSRIAYMTFVALSMSAGVKKSWPEMIATTVSPSGASSSRRSCAFADSPRAPSTDSVRS